MGVVVGPQGAEVGAEYAPSLRAVVLVAVEEWVAEEWVGAVVESWG